jgi:polysaccharide biosynthesis/export protein
LQAIARAGGLDDKANSKRVVVFRKIDGETKAAAFNLSEIRAGITQNPTIYGGDIVVVDGSSLKSTYREVISAIPLLAIFTTILR